MARVTAACNVVVLALGVAAVATGVAGGSDEASGQPAGTSAAGPTSPQGRSGLPRAGDDRPLADPAARMVDLPDHLLDYLPPGLRLAVLDGDPELDGGCAWIETDEGPQAVRWPAGSRAGFVTGRDGSVTLELVDGRGRVLARGGETVYFTGARSGAQERLERCHVGDDHVWYVGQVTAESAFEQTPE